MPRHAMPCCASCRWSKFCVCGCSYRFPPVLKELRKSFKNQVPTLPCCRVVLPLRFRTCHHATMLPWSRPLPILRRRTTLSLEHANAHSAAHARAAWAGTDGSTHGDRGWRLQDYLQLQAKKKLICACGLLLLDLLLLVPLLVGQ